MATQTDESARRVALDRIDVPDNVRELDAAHVQALAGSIALQGMLVPLVVRRAGERFELVAGFHRAAAARSLGLTEVPIVVREAESEDADRAVENIARKQLTALEEARAVRAMLQRGLTEDGAAQALGWAKARVTARVKILELPEAAQQLVGQGVIALGAVDNLLAVGRVSPELLDALVAYVDENRWSADRLSREPGWVLGQAMREGQVKAFGAYLNQAGSSEVDALRLGKKAAEQLAEAERLHRQVDRYAYGPPAIRFNEADVDQARAAGVLIESSTARRSSATAACSASSPRGRLRAPSRSCASAPRTQRPRRRRFGRPMGRPTRWPTRGASATAGCARQATLPTRPTSTSVSP